MPKKNVFVKIVWDAGWIFLFKSSPSGIAYSLKILASNWGKARVKFQVKQLKIVFPEFSWLNQRGYGHWSSNIFFSRMFYFLIDMKN